ncbi:MAG: flagellar hook-associated protein FlgK [Myxococcota bacterium]
MSLLALLQQGAMSLQAQQAYTSTASHNLQNANTVGYSRQRAELTAVTPADRYGSAYIGQGAMLFAVTQARDRFIETQMPAAIGAEMRSGTEMSTLQTVTALDLDASVAPALSNFYSQLRALAQNPGSANYREAAVASANQLALSFNRASASIEQARTGIDSKLEGRLPEINESLAQIARLNTQIRAARSAGGEPNDLLDARQKLGDRLAELTGARPVPNDAGDLNLVLPSGTALTSASAAGRLSVLPDPANRGHFQLYVTKPDGSSAQPLTERPGGELGGLLDARDGALKTSSDQLDQLAFDLSAAINTVAQTGVALDGSGGRDLFTGITSVAGAAQAMTINPQIAADGSLFPAGATSAPGDATVVQAMIGTENAAVGGASSAAGALARITSDFGAAAQKAQTMHEGDASMLSHLDGMRQSTSGVSVDEELVNMQKAQRAYEAITRVIKTADSMLETLMSLK